MCFFGLDFFELDFFAETLLLDERDDFALTFDLLDLLDLALLALDLLDLERDACAELFPWRREWLLRSGRFQPTARSARNDAGMLRMP